MNTDEKPMWIYTSLTVLLIIPTVFVLGLVVGSSTNASLKDSPVDIATWLGALATVAIAFLTYFLAAETWRLRRTQNAQIDIIRKESIRPQVEIFLEPSVVGLHFIVLVVENVGKGLAKNVSFKLMDNKSSFTESENEIINKLDNLNFYKNSISILGVNKSRRSFLFSFIDLVEKFNDAAFDTNLLFEISYSDMEGTTYTSNSTIDLSEYKGISEVGGNPAYKSYKEIEKIRRAIESTITGFRKVRVDSYSKEDRER